jgi:hypothetical protein
VLLDQLTQLVQRGAWGNFLDVSHLNGSAFPGGEYLLHALTQNTVPFRDLAATPSKEKIELDGLTLQIRPVVLLKGGHLRGKADAIPANLPSQLAQGKFLDLAGALRPWPNAIDWQAWNQRSRPIGLERSRKTSSGHSTGPFCLKSHEKGIKDACVKLRSTARGGHGSYRNHGVP